MATASEITIRVHCHNLPGTRFAEHDAVRLGIQKGDEVIEDVPSDTPEVTFLATFRVAPNAKSGAPNFLGPFAFGTTEQRFLYLNWGERHGDAWAGFRRLKIQLNVLTWPDIEQAVKTGKPISVSIDMTDHKGGPVCGSARRDNLEWMI